MANRMSDAKVKVVVTDYGFPDLEIERAALSAVPCELVAGQAISGPALVELVADADGIITQYARLDAGVIAALRKAKVIVRYGVGVDNIDLAAAAQRGIPVCNVPDYCIDEVADHALALILALTRQISPAFDRVRAGNWRTLPRVEQMLVLKKMTVGVVGLGRIGRAVVRRLQPFGCSLVGADPVVRASEIVSLGVEPVSLDELFQRSDLVTLHCPSNAETRGLVNRALLSKAKRGVLIVNVARGTVIQQDDLIAALRDGQVGGAGLDVADPEPLPAESPLPRLENVVLTNHIAEYSEAAIKTLRASTAETVARALRGEKLANVVNGL